MTILNKLSQSLNKSHHGKSRTLGVKLSYPTHKTACFQFTVIHTWEKFTPQVWKHHTQSMKIQISQFRAVHTWEQIHTPGVKPLDPIHKNTDFNPELFTPGEKFAPQTWDRQTQFMKMQIYQSRTVHTWEKFTPRVWNRQTQF